MDCLFTRPTDPHTIYYYVSVLDDNNHISNPTSWQRVLGLLADTYVIKDGILTNDGVEWVSFRELQEDFTPVVDQHIIRSFNLVKKL